MSLKNQMCMDMKACILNVNEFAENITYIPAGGIPKTIKAMVIRSRLDKTLQTSGRSLQMQIEVYLARDAYEGVTQVNKGADMVMVMDDCGKEPILWRVVDMLQQDAAVWHLLAQR